MVVRGIVLLVAGALGGMVGTAGGIMSLITYPALLAVGIPALPANVANLVAGVACWPGSAVASRPELAGRGSWLRRWSLVAAVGGGVGAGLLLSTPDQAFRSVVPFLVAAGSLALLFQPQLSALRDHGRTARRSRAAVRGRTTCGLRLHRLLRGRGRSDDARPSAADD